MIYVRRGGDVYCQFDDLDRRKFGEIGLPLELVSQVEVMPLPVLRSFVMDLPEGDLRKIFMHYVAL